MFFACKILVLYDLLGQPAIACQRLRDSRHMLVPRFVVSRWDKLF